MKTLSLEAQEFLKKVSGKKIVFTNGCFDILHKGHIAYLNEAKKLGDYLFVGINSDSSVKNLKGPTRPINNENDRKFVLSNLRCVDAVEIFSEETPLDLINLIHPSVLVKGGDWKIDQIVGAREVKSWGGEVLSLDFIDGYSTTGIIKKILND